MNTRPTSLVAAIFISAAALFTATSPVSATPAPDYGAAVRCHYEVSQRINHRWAEAQLRRIAVTPPQMPTVASTQSVGWRFVVTRSMDGNRGEPFRVVYRSPIQKGVGDGSFTTMRADITLPGDPEGDRFVWYRVTLKMHWYNEDGTVQNKVVYLMPNMHWIVGRSEVFSENYCPGLDAKEI